ncbi:prolyl oligopeptidase family serine peptidase [Vulgatibacter sp.]|uniref:prolyl oligopeptidase family serine peptidase n=1 Tax=Vulgatibacter sp. TaxID=1971226 RepID=UPI003567B1C3
MRIRLPLLLALAASPATALAAGPVTENLHGYAVTDAHRALESDAGAKGWIDRNNAAAEAFFAKLPGDRAAMEKRIDALSQVGGVAGASVHGDKTFFTRRTGDQEQPILYVRDGAGKETRLVDPMQLDKVGKVALDWYYPSPSGKQVVYGLSRDGSEDSVLHVLDVATGKQVGETIPYTRHASIAWLPDESGFYYTRYPKGDRYNRHVYFHRLGSDPAKDAYVFGKQNQKTDWVDVKLTPDGKRLFVNVSKGWAVSEIWMLEREKNDLQKVLPAELKALFAEPTFIDGRIVVRTNHEAPKFRVVAVDPKKPAPQHWKTLIAEGAWPLDGMAFVGGKLAVVRLEKAVSRLELYGKDGRKAGDVKLPDLGTISGADGEEKGDRLVITYASFLRPPGLYEIDVKSGKLAELATVPAPDVSKFVVEQLDYPSFDGTPVPMFVLRRKDVQPTGENPTLLTGYGGFNISLSPRFSPSALYWVERGGIFAVANLRGGSELGEEWHDAGRLANKHQVFRDFEYAMRHLIRSKWTKPAKLAITGGSNGGLLMGAMMTQAPELFRACVGRVGLYDMIRFDEWPPAELWVDEYGSAKNADQVGYLLGYSPYHQVMPGVSYPAFLGLTARADTRVTWIHTAKFVAALQEAHAGTAPILFHLEEKAGHGAGKGRSDRVKEEVMMFQFIDSQLAGDAQKLKAPARR